LNIAIAVEVRFKFEAVFGPPKMLTKKHKIKKLSLKRTRALLT